MKYGVIGVFAMSVVSLGCGGGASDAPKVVPAAGVINYNGAGVADATVVFYPEKGPVATGKTDAKGAFQVRTNGQLGATPGKNKVTVAVAAQAGDPPPADGNEMALAEKQSAVPRKYNSQDSTDLTVEIPAEGNKNLVLDLTD